MITRFPTHEVKIGNRPLGGTQPIRLQSMTNTPAHDIKETLAQCIRIFEAGADYVRISTPSRQSALNLEVVKNELQKAGFFQPIIADIHFKPELALIAARLAQKVRINPGNYTGARLNAKTVWTDIEYDAELESVRENVKPLIGVCKNYGTAIRIGTNFGSLSPRIISRYGNTAEGMVQSTIEFLRIFEDLGFFQTVVSLKASNPLVMIRSYLLMAERMQQEGMSYPLHLGVTEAGEGENGRIKSALGIGTLLKAGIGDTIRVSLSEPPEAEIPVAQKIAAPFQQQFTGSARQNTAYQVPAFQWQTSHTPALPGGHKAIVIAQASGDKNHCQAADLIVAGKPKHSSPQNACNNKEIIETATGRHFPLLSASQGVAAINNPEPDFSFFEFNPPGTEAFFEKLKNLPSPVILFSSPEGTETDALNNLNRQLKRLNVSAAIIPRFFYTYRDTEDVMLRLAADAGGLLLERKIHGLWVEAPELPEHDWITAICFGLLQAAGLRITQTEFISCPTCARTSFGLLKVLQQVKEKTGHLAGLKIAVMGCVVNGPGEMADADFGIMGAGPGKVHIYKGSSPLVKNLPEDQAAEALLYTINSLHNKQLHHQGKRP